MKNPTTPEGAASAQNPLPPGKGVVFIVNASTPEEAKNTLAADVTKSFCFTRLKIDFRDSSQGALSQALISRCSSHNEL